MTSGAGRRGGDHDRSAVVPGRAPSSRLYYGWVIVGVLAVTETISWGILFYAFSVFLVPMRDDLGWSTAAQTGAYSLALLVSAAAAPLVGRWLDRHGPRLLMTAGSIAGSLLILAWSAVDSLPLYYAIWAGLGLAMAATLYEPAFATATTWFVRDRDRALLLLTVVAGLASTIFLPVADGLVAALGWRRALVALALILAVTTIPAHAFVLRRRPEDLGLRPDGATGPLDLTSSPVTPAEEAPAIPLDVALRRAPFWWLTLGIALGTFASVAIGVHLIPYLVEVGYDSGFAAIATGIIGATQVVARVVATAIGRRWSRAAVTAVVLGLQTVALLLLLWWTGTAGVLLAVVLLGAGRGVVTLARAGLVADLFGRAHYGAIGGMLALFVTLARAAAPVAGGLVREWSNDYLPLLWLLVAISALSVLAMVRLDRR